jgi:hypothetical protein
MRAYRQSLMIWEAEHKPLVQAEQDAANALNAARATQADTEGRLSAAWNAVAQLDSELATATRAQQDAEALRNAAASAVQLEDTTLVLLARSEREASERRDHYQRMAAAIVAEPIARTELEAFALELARWLWELRRQRSGLLADKRDSESALGAIGQERTNAGGEFDALRAELDSEFNFGTNDVAPQQCVAVLGQAVAAAQARVDAAAKRLDAVAAKVAQHREE